MRPPCLFLLMLLLSACERQPEAVDTTLPEEKAVEGPKSDLRSATARAEQPVPPRTAFPCTGPQCRILTPDGWAGIKAGMTVAEATRASGFELRRPGHYDEFYADEPERLVECNIHELVGGPDNLTVFVEGGLVTSVGVGLGEDGGERFETDRGVGLGDAEAAVRRAYPGLKEEPDIYSEPPDKKLIVAGSNGNGIKFSINGGRVSGIDAGGPSIKYVEGCL